MRVSSWPQRLRATLLPRSDCRCPLLSVKDKKGRGLRETLNPKLAAALEAALAAAEGKASKEL